MIVVRFHSAEEHKDLLRNIKKMKEGLEEVEECLKDKAYDEEYEYEPEYREMTPHMRGRSRMRSTRYRNEEW